MVRKSNDIEQWLKFFLSGAIATAKDSRETFEKIIKLRAEYEKEIMNFGRQAKLGHNLLLFMFSKPIVGVKSVQQQLNIAFNTANSLIDKFHKADLLKEITGFSRNRLFMLWKYLDVFKK